ncbi:MAG TPA: bifunctional DNA-binding transcriptional regulator/O6-methylguanine-DNA methyltransferase Ada [Salinisphaeraceae bacterium]|nr:bifunctional DNA-binding transcriptional regulator/O6-methylguanine-DNA methyltransferase Ada [Salinisphaeraceae bacterium]
MQATHSAPTGFHSDAERWTAVKRRDSAADGKFYYSVSTTGVYCRPSCPSRQARREHVAFHATRADAERAGFRPCSRCRPDEPPTAEKHAAIVARACRQIEQADTPPTLAALASTAAMSRYHFHRIFKAATGVTPKAYADACRARRLTGAMAAGASVTQALYDAGYNSNSRFYASATARLGMTPSTLRAGGAGTSIRFAIGQCSLGAILVAVTAKGICAIQFGDDPDQLLQDLQERFHKARLIGADKAFERLVARVVGLVETPRQAVDLPLDIQGTAFQQRVWQALRDIPPGAIASYAEIAQRIDQPKAARAVANACAANEIAVAIPCHRVVRSDGSLSGYRWGVARKQELLRREAAP